MSFWEPAGLALGVLSIVASDWVSRMPKSIRNILTLFGFILLGYSGIIALQNATGMKMHGGPLAVIIGGLVVAAGGVIWHITLATSAAQSAPSQSIRAPSSVPSQNANPAPPQPQGPVAIFLGPNARKNKFRIRDGIFGFPTAVESLGSENTIDSGAISRDPMPPGYKPPSPSIPPIIDQSLTTLTNAQLRDQVNALNIQLLAIQQFHGEEIFNRPFMEEHERFTRQFDDVRPEALAIRNELLRRLNQPLVWDLEIATEIVNPDTPLAGPTPVSDLANMLAALAARLPPNSVSGH